MLLTRLLRALLLVVLISSCSFPEEPKTHAPAQHHSVEYKITPELEGKIREIDALVQKRIQSGVFSGVLLVADYGNIIYEKAAGYSDYRDKSPLTTHSVFQLASVSKMFTAAAVMLLEQDGLLDFDDPVRKHLPLFPFEDVTIRQLLMHRSGLPRYMVTSDLFWPRDTPMTNRDMYYLMAEHCPPRYFPPGYKFNYQNSNYAYLGYLVEVVSGEPFSRFVRQRIFEPLEMWDSYIYDTRSESDIPGMVKGHIYRRPRPLDPEGNYINGVVGDKGVYSSARDLLKFDQALYSDKLLSESSIQQAFTPGPRKKYTRRDDYGFGWRISTFPKDQLVYHYGWWNGFKTTFMRYLSKRRTIIVLTNRDRTLSLPKEIQKILYADEAESTSAIEFFSKKQ